MAFLRTRQAAADPLTANQRLIDSIVKQIEAKQKRTIEAQRELSPAENDRGRLLYSLEMLVKTGTNVPPEDEAARRKAADGAGGVVNRLREELRRLGEEQDELHRSLSKAYEQRRSLVAYGGRVVEPVTVPDWLADDAHTKLRDQGSRLQAQITEAANSRMQTERQHSAAEGQAKAGRIAALTGKGTQLEADEAQAAVATLTAQLEAETRTLADLREAAESVRLAREAREAVLRAERIPALMAAYAPLVREAIDALTVAAVASERMRPIFGALMNLGVDGSRLVAPWCELDATNPQSKINIFRELAEQRGLIGGAHDVAA